MHAPVAKNKLAGETKPDAALRMLLSALPRIEGDKEIGREELDDGIAIHVVPASGAPARTPS